MTILRPFLVRALILRRLEATAHAVCSPTNAGPNECSSKITLCQRT
jgi:hypothetical protein